MDEKWLYRIGVTLLPKVGPILAKNLISYCGSEEAVFKSKKSHLIKIPGIGSQVADIIVNQTIFKEAEEILRNLESEKIGITHYLDENFPKKLKFIPDSPIVLYYKGDFDFNHKRIISIVGTRNATEYGKSVLESWIDKLTPYGVYIVSGLAYGIDITAHKEALKNHIPTIGVLAHGLDIVYPGQHKSVADKMIENGGGLISEFPTGSKFIKENFPRRNRIVAAICDALIVIETKQKGGSMITAEIANSYSRDVYALPGSIHQNKSEGCNYLIKTHKAQLLDNIEDLLKDNDWIETDKVTEPAQATLDFDFYDPETRIVFDVLNQHKMLEIDQLVKMCKMDSSKIASVLLNLEFEGVVRALPGKKFRLAKI